MILGNYKNYIFSTGLNNIKEKNYFDNFLCFIVINYFIRDLFNIFLITNLNIYLMSEIEVI